MAIIWNPQSEMLREPNLLVPRKQPVGRVKIDWSLGITNKMRFCWDASQPIDLVSNSRWEQYGSSSDVQIVTHEGQRAAYFDGSSSMHFVNAQRQLTGDYFTIYLILYRTVDSGTYVAHRDGDDCNFQAFVSGGSGWLRLGGSSAELVSVAKDAWETLYIRRFQPSGSNVHSYANNKDYKLHFVDETGVDPGDIGVLLGARGDGAGAPTFIYTGYLATAFVWDRALSNAERTAIWLDPYHFMVPA